jgi:hypothetical protein
VRRLILLKQRAVVFEKFGPRYLAPTETGIFRQALTDATTGQPIPHFRVIAGWPTREPRRDGTFIEASRDNDAGDCLCP